RAWWSGGGTARSWYGVLPSPSIIGFLELTAVAISFGAFCGPISDNVNQLTRKVSVPKATRRVVQVLNPDRSNESHSNHGRSTSFCVGSLGEGTLARLSDSNP